MPSDHGALRALRQRNRDRLLVLLREGGPLHRAELARRAELSPSTVTTIVADLMRDGLVVVSPSGRASSSASSSARRRTVGRGGEILTLPASAGAALGVDYSSGDVNVLVADLSHRILSSSVAGLSPAMDWQDRLEAGLAAVGRCLDEAGIDADHLIGMGLGMPDPVNLTTGVVGRARAGQTWTGVHAAEEFARRLELPVALDNGSHVAGLAEAMWGASAGARNALFMKFSHGVGGGLLLDGRMFRGSIGVAGELGHVSVEYDGPACVCGNRGCLELYAGAPAVLAALRPVLGPQATIADVIGGVLAGDRACLRVVSDVGRRTGHVLANVCNLLNLELIVIGGELSEAGDILLEPMREMITRHALTLAASAVRVVPGRLGARAGALGAVALVLRESDRLGAVYLASPPAAPLPATSTTGRG